MHNLPSSSTYIISTRKIPVILFLLLVALLLVVYFCWESLYQERTIVQILKASASLDKHPYGQLPHTLEDWLKQYENQNKAPQLTKSETGQHNIKVPRFYELNISSKVDETKVVLKDIRYRNLDESEGGKGLGDKGISKHDDEGSLEWLLDEDVGGVDDQKLLRNDENQSCSTDAVTVYSSSFDRQKDEVFECRNLKVIPKTTICLYEAGEDIYISSNIRDTGIWEGHIIKKFQELLRGDSSLGVIDVGANLGLYSLVAANMGHNVLAIEPNPRSTRRIYKALLLQGTQNRVKILQNAITDSCGPMELLLNDYNQGDTRVKPLDQNQSVLNFKGYLNTTSSITLNDLLPFVPKSELILKLDIQGYEHKVLQTAAMLFDNFNIKYIFMEWVIMREFYVTDVHKSRDKDLVLETIDFLLSRHYVPFSSVSHKKLDSRFWFGWPEDVLWVHRNYAEN